MKSLIVLVTVISIAFSQRPDYLGDGRYYHDNSGAYNPEKFGNDGRYHPDDSGRYSPDDSGRYSGDYERYRHQEGAFGNDGRYFGDDSGRYIGNKDGVVGQQTAGSPTQLAPATVAPTSSPGSGNRGSGVYDYKHYDIINKVEQVLPKEYHFLYETENKIFGEERGVLVNEGTDDQSIQGLGYYEYTGPDGVVYRVDYKADKDGFVAQAEHLPTPPPTPEAILKALEYIKANEKPQ